MQPSRRSAVLTRLGVISLSSLVLAERQTTMKNLLALAALGLFAPLAVLADEPAEGGDARSIVPQGKFPPGPRVRSGIGQLMPAEHKPRPGFAATNLPRWQMVLGDDVSEQ